MAQHGCEWRAPLWRRSGGSVLDKQIQLLVVYLAENVMYRMEERLSRREGSQKP
jgi:hypothetical protein